MRPYILLLVLIVPIVLAETPSDIRLTGYVNDYANIISTEYVAEINAQLNGLQDAGIAEVAVVTVNNLKSQDIESFALQVAQGKLGDSEKNNGLLLLVSIEDRAYRFEVGRGIEPILNDAKVGRVGRNYLVPNFQNGEYGKGIFEAVQSINSILGGDTNSTYYISDTGASLNLSNYITSLIFFIIILSILGASSKRRTNRYFDAAFIAAMLLSGRGGGRGGFGGFGGGGFGGGGAGGRW